MKKIINSLIVTPNEVLNHMDIYIDDDIIVDIKPHSLDDVLEVYDAKGMYVLPGFIDLHSDYIETIVSPRSKIVLNLNEALYEFEKQCLMHGITSMYHSISLWDGHGAKPIREKEHLLTFSNLIKERRLIHNYLHIRYEIDNINQLELLKQMIEMNQIDLLSFMDHTPGQGQYRNIEHYIAYLKKVSNLDEHTISTYLKNQMSKDTLSIDTIKEIAELAQKHQIIIASHDDDTLDKLDYVCSLNTRISEFPITLEVALEAKKRDMFTIAGGPNVLLGGSTTGNLSALEGIKHQAIDILSSDYYPASLLYSVFKLFQMGYDLSKATNLVSLNPAKAMQLDHKKGSIEVGKIADLVLVDYDNHSPKIKKVLISGQMKLSIDEELI
jgi:phosphonate metabolism protein PhnM